MELEGALQSSAIVLVVDDEARNVQLAERILRRNGFTTIRTLTDPNRFAVTFLELRPDVILLDLHMPEVDGFRLLGEIARLQDPNEYLPTLVLTGDPSAEAREQALSAGAIDFLTKPLDETEVVLRVLNYLEVRRLHMRLVVRADELAALVLQRTRELEQARSEAFARLNLVSEFRDDETFEHTNRVGVSAGLLARAAGQSAAFASLMSKAAPLHDIGKIGIPDAILLKPGGLSPKEYEVMQAHCVIGGRIIGDTTSKELEVAKVISETHHERWNGAGYPYGLRGEAIPLPGRIVAVCDVFDALIHKRPYKPAWTIERALDEMVAQRGKHFDPELSGIFTEEVVSLLPWVNDVVNDGSAGGPCLLDPVGVAGGVRHDR